VDGGASRNDFLMQFQADVLGLPLRRPAMLEVTALGAAALAGLAVGFWRSRGELVAATDPGSVRFEPRMTADRREALYAGWKRAVERARAWAE
jgi:glycerol kinase